jgi:site-specific DNA-cytosine methylase
LATLLKASGEFEMLEIVSPYSTRIISILGFQVSDPAEFLLPHEIVIEKITIRDLHSLWLVLKRINSLSWLEAFEEAQKLLLNVEKIDFLKLVHLGQLLELLEDTDTCILTEEGHKFSTSQHWRLWQPSAQTQPILQKHGIFHYFIDAKDYENRPIVIDLFAGVGGLSLGFAAAGFNVALAVDNDLEACEAHKLNFPETEVFQGDVTKFAQNPVEFLKKFPSLTEKKIAGIIGGPPCQGFSMIGERSINDERNLLTSKFIDIVMGLQPDFFVMENVPGLAISGLAPTFNSYITRLASSSSDQASAIVDLLPTISKSPSKRSRQFKRKLIGSVVRKFYTLVEASFVGDLTDLNIADTFNSHYAQLCNFLSAELEQFYDIDTVKEILNNSVPHLAQICVTVTFEKWIKNKHLTSKKYRKAFQDLVTLFPEGGLLRQTIIEICDDYNRFPQAKSYNGKKVGPVLWSILERAGTLYNISTPQELNAASFGTPQNRTRLLIVGIRKDLNKHFEYPSPTHQYKHYGQEDMFNRTQTPTVQKAISDLPDIDELPFLIKDDFFNSNLLSTDISDFAAEMRGEALRPDNFWLPRQTWNPYIVDCSNRTSHSEDVKTRIEALQPGSIESISKKTRLRPDGLAPTLRAGTKANKGSHTAVRPIHYKYHRVISVREGARLMGYPDWMTFHKTKWHGFRLVGNGVPFPLANALATEIRNLCYAHFTLSEDFKTV